MPVVVGSCVAVPCMGSLHLVSGYLLMQTPVCSWSRNILLFDDPVLASIFYDKKS